MMMIETGNQEYSVCTECTEDLISDAQQPLRCHHRSTKSTINWGLLFLLFHRANLFILLLAAESFSLPSLTRQASFF